MPKNTIWTEFLFSYLPIGRTLGPQMLVRILLLLSFWFIGFVAYTTDNLMMEYLSNIQIYTTLFGSNLIILFGAFMMQNHLLEVILSFRSLLRMDDSQFRRFVERLEKYSYSFIPCCIICIILILYSSNLQNELQLLESLQATTIWNVSFTIFTHLLSGTGTWFVVSIWLVIFLISRQQLNIELSSIAIEKFRKLTSLVFYFSSFYFLTISIGIVISLLGDPAVSFVEFVVSPIMAFIAIGVLSVIFPLYNIHKKLLSWKNQELRNVQEEFENLRLQLDKTLEMESDRQSGNQTLAIIGRIFSLQMKERSVRTAPEWPFDVGFLSKMLGLVLIPAIVRILVEVFNRFYL